jgi:hypothetical protein
LEERKSALYLSLNSKHMEEYEINSDLNVQWGHVVAQLVEALWHKLKNRGFEAR